VSPLELMAGKILGQMLSGSSCSHSMAVSAYGAVFICNVRAAGSVLIVFLLIFFVLASLTFAALMAAIGSAVSEIREAKDC